MEARVRANHNYIPCKGLWVRRATVARPTDPAPLR